MQYTITAMELLVVGGAFVPSKNTERLSTTKGFHEKIGYGNMPTKRLAICVQTENTEGERGYKQKEIRSSKLPEFDSGYEYINTLHASPPRSSII